MAQGVMAFSDNIRAASFIVLSMASFTVNDTMMKLASPDLPFFQQIFLRGVVISLGLLILSRAWGELGYRASRRDRALTLLRTLCEALGTLFFVTALFNMPIANLTAILQALPLTVTLAAAVFFGEPVGWQRLAAILVGFVGVAIIIRPGMEGFTVYSIYGVLAVLVITCRDLASRRLSKGIPSSSVALSAGIGVTVLALVGSLYQQETWVMPDLRESLLIGGAAICLISGYMAAIAGMRLGEIGFVSPFRYVSLLVALLCGFFVFDEWPDEWTLIGAAIVVATGLFTLYRERKGVTIPAKGLRIR